MSVLLKQHVCVYSGSKYKNRKIKFLKQTVLQFRCVWLLSELGFLRLPVLRNSKPPEKMEFPAAVPHLISSPLGIVQSVRYVGDPQAVRAAFTTSGDCLCSTMFRVENSLRKSGKLLTRSGGSLS